MQVKQDMIKNQFRLIIFLVVVQCAFKIPVYAQTHSLDYFLEQGVQHSPLLQDYANQIQSASLDSLKVRAGLKPQVGATGVIIYAPTFNGYGYDEQITNGGTYAALAGINQRLLTNKYKQVQLAGIDVQKQDISNSSKISEHDLRKSIADQYIQAYQDEQKIIFSEQVTSLLRSELEIIRSQVQAGIYKRSDLLELSIELQANEIEAAQMMQQFRDDIFTLHAICGISDTASGQLEVPAISYHRESEPLSSPLFRKFMIDSLSIMSRRSLVDLNYRPRLNAFGDAGINAVALKDIEKRVGFSIGLNFSIPIYDGQQRKLEYSKLDLAEKTRKNYLGFISEQVRLRLYQLEAERQANEILIRKITEEENDLNTLLSMNKQELEKGNISVTEYILNLHRHIDLQQKLNETRSRSYSLVNEYNYLVW